MYKINSIVRIARAFVAIPLGVVVLGSAAIAQTFYNMAAANFSANFSNLATWSTPTNGSWSGVAIATTATNTVPDPLRVTTQSNTGFTSSTSGGIQKGTEALLFLSTGGTDNSSSVALDLLLNMTGRNAGTLSFDAATVVNGTPAAIPRRGTLSVYYSTDGTTWAALTGTSVPYVAINDGVAASGSANVALPAAISDKANVRLRFYYHNSTSPAGAAGNRPKISVDNVLVTSTSLVSGLPEFSNLTASATAGVSFSYAITATGSPTSYSVSTLPAGLVINTNTGVISGTPTVPGTYNLTLSAVNGAGTGSAILVLTVVPNPNAPVVSGGSTTGTVGTPFSYQISATNTPTSYSSGVLPAGLTLDTATGLISGTPTVGGTFNNISITASNSFGSSSGLLSIVIASAPVLQGIYSASAYVDVPFTFTFSATQNPSIYNAVDLPAGLVYDGVTTISGTPTQPGIFNITITATNSLGTDTRTLVLQVVDQAAQNAIPLNVVVNKYANGLTGQPDKVELLVLGSGTAGSSADLRGMILKDFSTNMTGDGGGKYQFAASGVWSSVNAGTLIVLSTGTTEPEVIDPASFIIRVNLDNPVYFTRLGGTFDIATTEFVMIKAAGMGGMGIAGGIHGLGGGTAGALFTGFTGKKLLATGTSVAGNGVYANTTNSAIADYNGTDATGGVAPPVFGAGNNTSNQTLINSLRTTPRTAIETWRFQQFGVYADTNDVLAGDAEDFDGDGIANLIEYATGTDPKAANAPVVVQGRSGDFLTLVFPRISDASLTYRVQASNDLASGFVTATGSVNTVSNVSTYTDNVSLATPGVRRFLRLQVTYGE